MKFEITSLETEPLVYFLLHSAIFVTAVSFIFFLLGLWFGALTWGRYKKKNRMQQEEMRGLREEVAGLKRKLTEQVIRPATGPLGESPPALLTEVLPKPSEIFPERAANSTPELTPKTESAPTLTLPASAGSAKAPTAPPPEATKPAPAGAEPESETTPLPLPLIPELAPIPGITHHTPEQVAELLSPREPKSPDPAPPRVTRELPEPNDVEPFSFLLSDSQEGDFLGSSMEPEEPLEAEVAPLSPLHAIAHAEPPAESVEAVAPPSVTILPEIDASLGLVYRQSPAVVEDLTRVRGISPALQKRLQELGIYRLQQIAGWSPAHIREFSRRLAFKDRIERERWVEQARRLMDG